MEKITVKVNSETEMYAIFYGDKCISSGNYWDFNRPGDFKELFESMGLEVSEIDTNQSSYDGLFDLDKN